MKLAKDAALTRSEERMAHILEQRGAKVFRPSWPDFIVEWPDGEVEFLEIKDGSDQIERGDQEFRQRATFDLLSRILQWGEDINLVVLNATNGRAFMWDGGQGLVPHEAWMKERRSHPRLRKLVDRIIGRELGPIEEGLE